ncbi:MAG: hypothetical protein ABJA67_08395 [Chthonomonadales bacterium]
MLDLRYLNEKASGENGFVKLNADGSGFVLGNGSPARFWAVGSDVYRASAEDIARHVKFLAKMGVNMVRLHTQIAPINGTLTDVNEKEIDGIWRMVAACKKEGIYVTISPYWANEKDASKWGIAGYPGKTDLWGLLFFDETLQQGYKAWVKALYSRVNPHSGVSLAKDPTVAIIQVQNEDSLFFWTMQGLKPAQQEKLGMKFGTWLTKKYGSLSAAKSAWGGTRNDKDDFTMGKVGLFNVYFMTQPQSGGMAARVSDETQFFADTQFKFYKDIAAYYRTDLGCKQLINASNWITAEPIRLNDLERWTYTATDVLAVNKYTGGVHTGENNGWRIDPGHHYTAESCLLNPRNLPTNLKQVVGRPILVTESTWVSPEPYQSEGPMLVAAYSSLTGVDAFYWFSATTPEYERDPYFNFVNINGNHALYKWTCSTPTLMGSFPAAALIYRTNCVQKGKPVVHEERSMAQLFGREIPAIAEDKSFDPNRYSGNTLEKNAIKGGVDPLAFLVGPVEEKFDGNPASSYVGDLTKYIDHSAKTVQSVTGEVSLNYGIGTCTINTPKAQGVIGFLSKTGEIRLKDFTVRSGNEYASVVAVSMDGLPLATSRKVLLQVVTTARPTGWKSTATDFKSDDGKQTFHGYVIDKTGTMPWQMVSTDASVTLHNPFLRKMTILDAGGFPIKSFDQLSRSDGRLTFKVPAEAMYMVLE